MTCTGCQSKVQYLLSKVPGVKSVNIDLSKGEAEINMDHHIPAIELKKALADYPKYQLTDLQQPVAAIEMETTAKSWFQTYKPVLLILVYITGLTLLIEYRDGSFVWMRWMNHFMAGFFLVFSFFKLLNLKEFSESYSTYDIIAKKWKDWGYAYAFIELALGVAYLTGFNPFVTNSVTLVVMTLSIIGVIQSVMNKRKIKCACLGAVFNLPMSTVTIIEDALMIVMSGIMLLFM